MIKKMISILALGFLVMVFVGCSNQPEPDGGIRTTTSIEKGHTLNVSASGDGDVRPVDDDSDNTDKKNLDERNKNFLIYGMPDNGGDYTVSAVDHTDGDSDQASKDIDKGETKQINLDVK